MTSKTTKQFEVSIAPMMAVSYSQQRQLWRKIAPKALIYSEMLSVPALLYSDPSHDVEPRPFPDKSVHRMLRHAQEEKPIALQLAGNNPPDVARAVRRVRDHGGWQEVNLNAGCPSVRVAKGNLGLALMRTPDKIGEILHAMLEEAGDMEVSLKCRIGIEGETEDMFGMCCETLAAAHSAGCRKVVIHARAGSLKGISPKKNRRIPKLNYPLVERLAETFPELKIILNGGIDSPAKAAEVKKMPHIAGLMIGRMARDNPQALYETVNLLKGNLSAGQLSENGEEKLVTQKLMQALCDHIDSVDEDLKNTYMIPLSRFVHAGRNARLIRILINDLKVPWHEKRQTIANYFG